MERLSQREKAELAEVFAALRAARESKFERFYRVVFKDFFSEKIRSLKGETKKLPKLA